MINDLVKNPPKTVPAASAEATKVLSVGRRSRSMKAITNTIANEKTAVGIQYVTALEGPVCS